ncbi:MAG: hypothetical protein II063_10420 [Prevotella sp.]|nr:hypothetical protein [Prevotella sp.]
MEENIKRFYDDVYGGESGLSESGVDGAIGGFFMWCRHCVSAEFRGFSLKGIGRVKYVSIKKVFERIEKYYQGDKIDEAGYHEARRRVLDVQAVVVAKRKKARAKVVAQAKERFGDDYDFNKLCLVTDYIKEEEDED